MRINNPTTTHDQLSGVTATQHQSAATQANQAAIEAETNEDSYIPPDLLRYGPGVAKVWCCWEQEGAHGILLSYNMTSVTDGGGAGDSDLVFDTDFSSANYATAIMATGWAYSMHNQAWSAKAAGTMTVKNYSYGTQTFVDNVNISLVCFGDQ